MEDSIIIVPLEPKYLNSAAKLVNSIFDESDMEINPADTLIASLSVNEFIEYTKHKDNEVTSFEYFVALINNEVTGIVGLYTLKRDTIFFNKTKNAVWLDWFCVSPKYRRRNIGSKLLEFAVSKAGDEKKDYLLLYTSTHKSEVAAQFIYEKFGFAIIDTKPAIGYELLLRCRKLKKI